MTDLGSAWLPAPCGQGFPVRMGWLIARRWNQVCYGFFQAACRYHRLRRRDLARVLLDTECHFLQSVCVVCHIRLDAAQ